MKIEIYSTNSCKYCKDAKDFFAERDLQYQEYNVYTDVVRRKEMIEKTGQMGVPVISIDGKFIVGFNKGDLIRELENGTQKA